MKKVIIFISILSLFLPFGIGAQVVEMHFFYGDGCPHCGKEMEFLEDLKQEFPGIKINSYEVYNHPENTTLLMEKAREMEIKNLGVPFLVLDGEAVVGYMSDDTTGREIRRKVMEILNRKEEAEFESEEYIAEELFSSEQEAAEENIPPEGIEISEEDILATEEEPETKINISEKDIQKEGKMEQIDLPLLGKINIKDWSLPLLTVLIAALDGFNPCAMWVLLFLISLLLGMENKKKMWVLGFSFISVSALVYFLFLSAWLNLFLFIGFISFVRLAIGIVAVGSGIYHFKEWYCNKDGTCHVTGAEKKKKIMDKLCEITGYNNFWLALGGIIIMAFAVNLIELICSAGLPAIYTHILSLSEISRTGYYAYLLLYISIFMLDDMLIFVIAMTSLKMVGVSTKYSRWSNLIGGIIIFILGILLIFKPGWIMFG